MIDHSLSTLCWTHYYHRYGVIWIDYDTARLVRHNWHEPCDWVGPDAGEARKVFAVEAERLRQE